MTITHIRYRVLLSTVAALMFGSSLLFGQTPSGSEPGVEPSADGGGSAGAFVLARLKYEGGGDWYNDQGADVNMLEYLRAHTTIDVRPEFEYVDISSDAIFKYPLLFLTGHGNVSFSDDDVKRLRAYLDNGGFLYIDDDYGLDTAIRREMRKVFPDQEFKELPFSHAIYHCYYTFDHGLPKIHEHDGKPPRGYGLFDRRDHNRLCVFYTVETNPSDGWADPDVHNDPPKKREEAFKIGTNIIVYALTN
jgi:hypothetical protein